MFETTDSKLAMHLNVDLGIQEDDLVFMFSGIFGLGKLEDGLNTIESAIQKAIPRGTLIVPTFSYSWSNGEEYNENTQCPEMGSFSNYVLQLPNYIRTRNPNFSVAIRKNNFNRKIVDSLINVGDDCFGKDSIFEKVVNYSQTKRAWILLLGGAFNDVKYRSTFIHYAQQKIGVRHRYVKKFHQPNNSQKYITQLVRCLTMDEYLSNSGNEENIPFNFPIEEDYSSYGEDLDRAGLITEKEYGYYPSRMVSVKESVEFYIKKLRKDPYYCIQKESLAP